MRRFASIRLSRDETRAAYEGAPTPCSFCPLLALNGYAVLGAACVSLRGDAQPAILNRPLSKFALFDKIGHF